jgi:hypothetical protein
MFDYRLVYQVLDDIHRIEPITCIIEGGTLGADRFARHWAKAREVMNEPCPVQAVNGRWPAAGPRHNARMLREKKPDRAVAFIADIPTRAMADMVRRCILAKLPLLQIGGAGIDRPRAS